MVQGPADGDKGSPSFLQPGLPERVLTVHKGIPQISWQWGSPVAAGRFPRCLGVVPLVISAHTAARFNQNLLKRQEETDFMQKINEI